MMKLIGFSSVNGQTKMVLKGDSSLLQNRKPFFAPDGGGAVLAAPCLVARICRLGKGIAQRYASRYYDAIAPGLDFRLEQPVGTEVSVEAWAFDYSLAVGTFMPPSEAAWFESWEGLIPTDEAIRRISEVMTIRQGDMVFIDTITPARRVQRDEVIRVCDNEREVMYCKIK